jgi:hypothetical protein
VPFGIESGRADFSLKYDEGMESSNAVVSESRARNLLSLLLAVLAGVGILLSSVGIWAQRSFLDESNFKESADLILKDPAVITSIGSYVTDETMKVLDVQGALGDLLPSQLSSVAPVLSSALRGVVQEQVENVIKTEPVRKTMVSLVSMSHDQFLNLLEKDDLSVGAIGVSEGTVSLNLVPIVTTVLQGLQDEKLLPKSLDIPNIDSSLSTNDQVKALGEALGVALPAELGQVVLYESAAVAEADSTVANAQRALRIFNGALKVLVGLTVLLSVLVVLSASNKRRGLRNLSVASMVAFALGLAGINRAVAAVPELVTDADAAEATRSILSVLTDSLISMSWTLLVVSLLLVLWAVGGEAITSIARRFNIVSRCVVVLLIALYLSLWGATVVTLVVSAVAIAATMWWLQLAWWRPSR